MQLSGMKYIYITVQPSPPSISGTFASSPAETVLVKGSLPTSPPPAPGARHPPSVSVNVTTLGTSYEWNRTVFILL